MLINILEEQHQRMGDLNVEIEQLKKKMATSQEQEDSEEEEAECKLKDFFYLLLNFVYKNSQKGNKNS